MVLFWESKVLGGGSEPGSPHIPPAAAHQRWKYVRDSAKLPGMKQEQILAPEAWRAALDESDAQIVRGDLVPAQSIHDELRAAIAELEAEAEAAP